MADGIDPIFHVGSAQEVDGGAFRDGIHGSPGGGSKELRTDVVGKDRVASGIVNPFSRPFRFRDQVAGRGEIPPGPGQPHKMASSFSRRSFEYAGSLSPQPGKEDVGLSAHRVLLAYRYGGGAVSIVDLRERFDSVGIGGPGDEVAGEFDRKSAQRIEILLVGDEEIVVDLTIDLKALYADLQLRVGVR